MANPFNVINPNNPYNNQNMYPLRTAYQMFNNAQNPMAMFNQIAMKNPKMQTAMELLQSGNSPEQVYRTLCQKQGVNPDEFLAEIQRNI